MLVLATGSRSAADRMFGMLKQFTQLILHRSVSRLGVRSGILAGCFLLSILLGPMSAKASNQQPEEAAVVPWSDGERMHFGIQEKKRGPIIGDAIFTITEASRNDEPAWKIRIDVIMDQQAVSIVEVDQERFLPVYSSYKSNVVGEVEAEYGNGGVSIEHRLKNDSRRYKQSDRTYDIHQSCYLMRQFPIDVGYQREMYTVNSKRPVKQVPTVMQIVDIETIKTPMGAVKCYRVDVRMGDSLSSFWIGADERRLLYRIEERSGTVLQLLGVDQLGASESKTFRSEKFGYSLTMPDDCFAFIRDGRSSVAEREYVVFLLPEIAGEFSMIRHHKFGEIEEVLKGSIQWLTDNKQDFHFDKTSRVDFHTNGFSGTCFEGDYQTEDGRYGIYNAILEKRDGLYIFTGSAPMDTYETIVPLFDRIVKSISSD